MAEWRIILLWLICKEVIQSWIHHFDQIVSVKTVCSNQLTNFLLPWFELVIYTNLICNCCTRPIVLLLLSTNLKKADNDQKYFIVLVVLSKKQNNINPN